MCQLRQKKNKVSSQNNMKTHPKLKKMKKSNPRLLTGQTKQKQKITKIIIRKMRMQAQKIVGLINLRMIRTMTSEVVAILICRVRLKPTSVLPLKHRCKLSIKKIMI